MFQNTPNPFKSGVTTIGFNLPEATEATLTISDVSGKILRVVQGNYPEGYNMIELNSADFNATGVMYYQLETAKNTATKKLIILE
ncbi:MAG: T9SS type A sorting domain-containing protein [Saprospiraceae bacterium]